MKAKRIIQTELLKLPQTGNYVLLGLLLLTYAGFTFGFFKQVEAGISSNSFFDLGKQILSAQLSLAGTLISIFMISNVGKEYKNGTLKKNLIDGFTRSDFYSGKFGLLIICVVLAFCLGILSLFIGAAITGNLESFNEIISYTFLTNFFIKLFYSALFATFLVFLFKRITISIVLYFLWGMIEQILIGVQNGLGENLGIPASFNIQEYLPKNSIDFALNTSSIIEPKAYIISSIYILLMVILPYYLFTKADIKS